MKRIWCASLVFGVLATPAYAGLIFTANDFFVPPPDTTSLKIRNFETEVNVQGGTAGTLEVGDRLRGILNVTSSNNTSGTIPGGERLPSGFEVTGLFDVTISSVVADGSNFKFEFVPTPGFAAEIGGPAGSMVALYNHTTPNFDPSTIASGIATSTDGSLYMVLGADGAWGTEYYWAAFGAAVPLGPAGQNVATFAASLALLVNNSGLPFNPVITQNPPVTGVVPFPAALGAIQNAFGVQGNVTIGDGSNAWPFFSQDPIRAQVLVPEPASMLVWAGVAGVFGVVGYRRRKALKK